MELISGPESHSLRQINPKAARKTLRSNFAKFGSKEFIHHSSQHVVVSVARQCRGDRVGLVREPHCGGSRHQATQGPLDGLNGSTDCTGSKQVRGEHSHQSLEADLPSPPESYP